MTFREFPLVLISALCTAAANLLIRSGVLRAGGLSFAPDRIKEQVFALIQQPAFVLGLIFYVIAAVIWFRVVSTGDLTTSYPLLVSLTFLMVTLGAILIFNETVSWHKVFGLGVIITGIILVARA